MLLLINGKNQRFFGDFDGAKWGRGESQWKCLIVKRLRVRGLSWKKWDCGIWKCWFCSVRIFPPPAILFFTPSFFPRKRQFFLILEFSDSQPTEMTAITGSLFSKIRIVSNYSKPNNQTLNQN